jgi:hypothetical protein
MIIVEANLRSALHESRDKTLCRVEIVNKETNKRMSRATYEVRLYSRGRSPRLIKTAYVENWPRNAVPAWRLVQAAFAALGE